ncbi:MULTISPECIES: class I adenylate-forming enzyme family protein [unclassified Streptomyces]|uniref:class I adenylate-forming enzyme family protein n=1 Tax=unclassified Streptomyces TaxID=2593676 RepID=UPI0033D102DA
METLLSDMATDGLSVTHLMAHRVHSPGKSGVADADGFVPLRSLLLQAVRKADLLRRSGVARGDRLALDLSNKSWASVSIDYLACAWLGACAVLAEDHQLLGSLDGPVTLMDDCIDSGDVRHGRSDRGRPSPGDPLDILFSSGTTGTPKPIVFHHKDWVYRPSGAASRVDKIAHYGIPFGTSTGVHGILLQHIAAGAVSVAAKTSGEVFDLVKSFDCNQLVVTPYALQKLINSSPTADAFEQIKTVKVVAGPVTGSLASAAIDAFPNARIFSIYGATELGGTVFTRLVKRGEPNGLGVPSPGAVCRIVDERGAPLPPGEVGQIQVAQGPAAANMSIPTQHWISVGDMGYMDKVGQVHLVGRAKEILFLSDRRSTPGKIEEGLLQIPLVEDVGVAAIDNVDGCDRLGACVVLKDRDKVREAAEALAQFDPPLFRIRYVSSIPRTSLGKPLRDQIWHLLMDSDAEGVWLRP